MGRRAGLDLSRVVDVAEAIADEQGYEAVTLVAVADRLEVRSPSLYHHVAGLPDLRRQLSLRAATSLRERLEAAVRQETGAEAVRDACAAYRGFAREHPGLHAALTLWEGASGPDELEAAIDEAWAPLTGPLGDLGLAPEEVVVIATVVRSYLLGFSMLERSGRPEPDRAFEQGVDAILVALTGEEWTRPSPTST